ncbi:MAG: TrkH family potassium uptake protein [Desulfobacteraceae bacterium]|nr:TrkH family potassium uptake protein [Desulfobacteraceae bacterium]
MRSSPKNKLLKLHPAVLVLISFLSVIFLGTLLLMLPLSTKNEPITFINALFTATSAVCVTGLTVVDTGTFFTLFGQGVILLLIQIGGLGVTTISVALFRWIGKSISIRQRMAMQDTFAHTPRKDIIDLVKNIIFVTLGIECIGAILLALFWFEEFPFFKAVYYALFHSISAFCNAGFSLFPENLMRYSDHAGVVGTVATLIIVGGIGFPVLYEIQSWTSRRTTRKKLSIHTKAVLWTTLILIVGGALLLAMLEYPTHAEPGFFSGFALDALFQSITCRTAGFNTIDIASLHDASLAVMIFLMFFGASPGSCGGGVKTTTLALLTAFAYSRLTRQQRVNMFKKSIPTETLYRGTALILLATTIVALVTFMLLAGETTGAITTPGPHRMFLPYLFETVSAFGTVGLSMGVTPLLGAWSKSWIILTMLVGRVGVLTFSYIVVGDGAGRRKEYAEENMMIG